MTCMSHETITSQPETSAISPRTGSWKVHRKLPEGISSWPPGLFSRQKLESWMMSKGHDASTGSWPFFSFGPKQGKVSRGFFLKNAKSLHEWWGMSMLQVSESMSSPLFWNSSADLKFTSSFLRRFYSFLNGFNRWRQILILIKTDLTKKLPAGSIAAHHHNKISLRGW